MSKANSFPPPSTQDEDKVVIRVSAVLGGMLTIVVVSLLHAAVLNGLYTIATNGGIVDWTLSFVDIFLAVLFVQFIRLLDAAWRKRL